MMLGLGRCERVSKCSEKSGVVLLVADKIRNESFILFQN